MMKRPTNTVSAHICYAAFGRQTPTSTGDPHTGAQRDVRRHAALQLLEPTLADYDARHWEDVMVKLGIVDR
jgi:hypothetical protein